MRIEEIESLAEELDYAYRHDAFVTLKGIAEQTIAALRAEAWHPIDKAEELGAKDGRDVMIRFFSWGKHLIRVAKWDSIVKGWLIHGDFCTNDGVTHFRFINKVTETRDVVG